MIIKYSSKHIMIRM